MPDDDTELALLRRLWDIVWNETGAMDNGSGYALYTWEDETKVIDAASAIEDHYAEHGFPERDRSDA